MVDLKEIFSHIRVKYTGMERRHTGGGKAMAKRSDTRNSLKTLKFRNRKLVLNYMRTAGPVSVNDISHSTALSKMTVHKIIDHYIEEGMVALAGKGDSTEEGGKKPNLFAFNPDCRYIFAVRLAGDFFSANVVNLKGEAMGASRRVSIENATFEDVVRMIGDEFVEQVAANNLPKEHCFATVVGYNGVVDADRGVALTAYQHPGWGADVPFRESLEALMPGDIPVHVDSWWKHLAHGEAQGALRPDEKTFFLIGNLGNSLSGGMVVDGHVFRGATGFAGEVGHMIVAPKTGLRCVCGGCGCLEVMVAPVSVMRRARERRERFPESPIFAENPEDDAAGLHAAGEAADAGDALARELMDEVAGHFAVAVNNIIFICDPGRIVFFGDYARCGGYFLEQLKIRAGDMTMHGIDKRTEISLSTLDDDDGVVGAACHMTDKLFAGK